MNRKLKRIVPLQGLPGASVRQKAQALNRELLSVRLPPREHPLREEF